LSENSGQKMVHLEEPFVANRMLVRFWGDSNNYNRFRANAHAQNEFLCMTHFYMDVAGMQCERCLSMLKMGAYYLM